MLRTRRSNAVQMQSESLKASPLSSDRSMDQQRPVIGPHTLGDYRINAGDRPPPIQTIRSAVDVLTRQAQAPIQALMEPIQCTKWTWSAAEKKWKGSGKNPPTHTGDYDGEEFDDEYAQETDPTVKPYLTGGDRFMGWTGAEKQLKGITPTAEQIRVNAVKHSNTRGGTGQHELLPTNTRDLIAKAGNPTLAGLQSGLRTGTSQQLFRRELDKRMDKKKSGIEIGAHTGFATKTSGKGSTHTKGQAAAHDKLRATEKTLLSETDPVLAANAMMLTHLETTPTGTDIVGSEYIEDMVTNSNDFMDTDTGKVNKIKLAQDYQERREEGKRRTRALKRDKKRGRSPSPPRAPIDDKGGGGEYLQNPTEQHLVVPLPNFGGANPFEKAANIGAYLTQPQREGYALKKRARLDSSGNSIDTSTPDKGKDEDEND